MKSEAAADPDLLAGTPYRAVRILGEGGMGFVIEAEHRSLGKRFAVKLLHANFTNDPLFVDRLRVEAEVLAHLESPHVVGVTNGGITDKGDAYIAMDLLRGKSLAQEIRARGEIPMVEAVDFVRQALRGVIAAHALGIVHRDLKPANLFLADLPHGAGRVVKVLDFGVAKIVAPESSPVAAPHVATREGVAIGSPRTMSPEQCRADPVDVRSDVYSMGIVLYMLLSGRGPFDHHQGLRELAHAHVEEVPKPPSALAQQPIRPAIDAIVLRAIAKKPSDRFATAADFEAALAEQAAGFEREAHASTEPKSRPSQQAGLQHAAAPQAAQVHPAARDPQAFAEAARMRGGTMKIEPMEMPRGGIVEVGAQPARAARGTAIIDPGGTPRALAPIVEVAAGPVVRPTPPAPLHLRGIGAREDANVRLSTKWVLLGVGLSLLVFGGLAALFLHLKGFF